MIMPAYSLITAHRGASGLAPENTMSALRKAMEIGADFAEIDIHTSRDGEFVLMHDDTLDRTTNGIGFVRDYPVSHLKKLDAGSWFSPFYKNEPVPILSEVIHLVQGRMKLNIEIKATQFKSATAVHLLKLIQDLQFTDQCILTSFDQEIIEHLQSLSPALTTGVILDQRPTEPYFKGPWKLLSVNYRFVNSHVIERASAALKEIHVWTVDETEEMDRCIALGVHNIITNYPNRLKNVLVEHKTSQRA